MTGQAEVNVSRDVSHCSPLCTNWPGYMLLSNVLSCNNINYDRDPDLKVEVDWDKKGPNLEKWKIQMPFELSGILSQPILTEHGVPKTYDPDLLISI